MGWTLATFAANALGLLTKGLAAPVLLGGILIWSLPWAWRTPRLRNAVLRLLFDPLGWLVFLAIGAPWFILVDRANPGHAQFFFIHEHFQRYATHIHKREGSSNPVLDKLYFAGILLVGLLPWLSASLIGLRRAATFLRRPGGPRSEQAPFFRWTVAALLLALAVPLLFFTLSDSKLPPYILMVVVPVLALACAFEREGEARASLKRTGWELLALGGVIALAAPFVARHAADRSWMLAAGLAFLGLGLWARRARFPLGPRWMAALGAALLLLMMAAQKLVGPGKSVGHLVRQAPADAQWVSCGNYFQGIPFYAGQRVTVIEGTGELAFGKDRLASEEQARWFPEDRHALGDVGRKLRAEAPARPVWAIVARHAWNDLAPGEQEAWAVVDRTSSSVLVRLK